MSEDVVGELERRLGRRVTVLARQPHAYRTSHPLEALSIRLEDGRRLELLLKDVGCDALAAGTRRAKPAFLHDPLREVDTYRRALNGARLGTATYYGAGGDEAAGRCWLLLERVRGVELWQVGEFESWREAARWLARLHALFSSDVDRLAARIPLLRYDGALYRVWLARALTFASADALAGIAARYETVVERLCALPRTLVHGEFYASNVLVRSASRSSRICPVDWEMAGIAPGLLDVAALSTGWPEKERRALALAYRDELPADHRTPEEEFFADLDRVRLHLAIQWLGWSPDWTPPPEHRQDWLSEAMAAAERLAL